MALYSWKVKNSGCNCVNFKSNIVYSFPEPNIFLFLELQLLLKPSPNIYIKDCYCFGCMIK